MNTSHARQWEKSYENASLEQTDVVKVRQARWITKGEKILYICVGLCLLIAAVYIVSYSSSTDAINRDIQSLEEKIADQEVVNENLAFEKKDLERPERIIEIARENGLNIQNAQVKQAGLLRNK